MAEIAKCYDISNVFVMKRKLYIPPEIEVFTIWVEDRMLLTDGSGSQFDDIGDGGEGGGDGWDIL